MRNLTACLLFVVYSNLMKSRGWEKNNRWSISWKSLLRKQTWFLSRVLCFSVYVLNFYWRENKICQRTCSNFFIKSEISFDKLLKPEQKQLLAAEIWQDCDLEIAINSSSSTTIFIACTSDNRFFGA